MTLTAPLTACFLLASLSPATAQETFDCLIDPSLVIEVGSAETGIIEQVYVSRGDVVTTGQPIAQIESAAELAALDYTRARASDTTSIEIAEARVALVAAALERAEALASTNNLATAALDERRAEFEEANLGVRQVEFERSLAQLDQTRVEAQLARRVVRSPVDGLVVTAMVGPGEYVFSEAPVVQIAQISPLHVEVFLPTDYYPQMKLGEMATVLPADPIGGAYRAEIVVIDKVFDAASDTFGMRLRLANDDQAIPAGIDCRIHFD
ncbi:MAG: efflux RND transporter periplasmic adaptor subunit [Yoonia sp.]|uniref:efflux RND transporter periplasmic adaptor subunit n=1 Tax=Yoonia sp. TaxID=2212373 RepID=UPI003EF60E69